MCNAVAPHKDVNGYNIVNVGRLTQQLPTIMPCMVSAVREIILRTGMCELEAAILMHLLKYLPHSSLLIFLKLNMFLKNNAVLLTVSQT